MLTRTLLLVCLVCASLAAGVKKCGLPSHLWCSSRQTARDCHVTEHCRHSDWSHIKAAPAVNLTLYYESLCPFCKMFITEQLFPTFQKLGVEVLNVTALPFGNAEMTQHGDKWVFNCQHGKDECAGNLMATCAINSTSYNVSAYLPFLNCMEESSSENVKWNKVLKKCGPKFNMSETNINSCISGNLGNTLEHQMGVATKNAGVLYVPWIVINGQHTQEIQTEAQHELLKLVCKTYNGPKPEACSDVLDNRVKNVSFKTPGKSKFIKKH